ncbi:expressed unknown protein [Seminavis robusta]|uniref:Uncharacterized protein n=1 Tax=Seminavis robusta TaxID=568900 RepID=A0A9N8HMF1_9STRA|nr:expressed unknown protein [Seminavis robusta]|eukprot:Sro901_g218010.1 n/a (548) ;mRNA; r:22308-23951
MEDDTTPLVRMEEASYSDTEEDDTIEASKSNDDKRTDLTRMNSLKISDLDQAFENATVTDKPLSRSQRRFQSHKLSNRGNWPEVFAVTKDEKKIFVGNPRFVKDPLASKSDHGPSALSSYRLAKDKAFGSSATHNSLSSFLSLESLESIDDDGEDFSHVCVSDEEDSEEDEDEQNCGYLGPKIGGSAVKRQSLVHRGSPSRHRRNRSSSRHRRNRSSSRHRRNIAANSRARRASASHRMSRTVCGLDHMDDHSHTDDCQASVRNESARRLSVTQRLSRSCEPDLLGELKHSDDLESDSRTDRRGRRSPTRVDPKGKSSSGSSRNPRFRRQVTDDGSSSHKTKTLRSKSQTQLRRCSSGMEDRVSARMSRSTSSLQQFDSAKTGITDRKRTKGLQPDSSNRGGKDSNHRRKAGGDMGLRRQDTREGRRRSGKTMRRQKSRSLPASEARLAVRRRSVAGDKIENASSHRQGHTEKPRVGRSSSGKTMRRQKSRSLSSTRINLRRSSTVADENDNQLSQKKCPAKNPEGRNRGSIRRSSTSMECDYPRRS